MEKCILLLAGLVTCEAALGVFFGISSEGENELVRRQCFSFVALRSLLSLNVRFSWTVTGLATHHSLFARCQPRVGGLVVLDDFGPVTRSAPIIPDEGVRRGRRRRCSPCHRGSGWWAGKTLS